MTRAEDFIDMVLEAKAELSLKDLFDGTLIVRKGSPFPQDVSVRLLATHPAPGVKTLRVNGEARGENLYNQTIIFHGVEYVSEKDGKHFIPLSYKSGTEVKYTYMAPLKFNESPVRVWCSCMDFRFRFEMWNEQNGALVAPRKPRPYTRKTTTRSEVNPDHIPGFCKHIGGIVKRLQTEGVLR